MHCRSRETDVRITTRFFDMRSTVTYLATLQGPIKRDLGRELGSPQVHQHDLVLRTEGGYLDISPGATHLTTHQ